MSIRPASQITRTHTHTSTPSMRNPDCVKKGKQQNLAQKNVGWLPADRIQWRGTHPPPLGTIDGDGVPLEVELQGGEGEGQAFALGWGERGGVQPQSKPPALPGRKRAAG